VFAAMATDRRVLDRKTVEQLQGLGEVARGHAHLVTVLTQQFDHGSHHEHVRAVGQIDPHTHWTGTLAPIGARGIVVSALSPKRFAHDRYRCAHMAHALVLASISESLVNALSHFVRDAGLPGIFALMALSSACIPIPSEVVMLFAGFAVADPTQSAAHHHMTMAGIVLVGLAGTMVGSWVTYAIGRGGRLELFERHGAKLHMGPAQIERADRFFARYGEQTVLFGRMIPLVRAFVSLPAGVSRMPLGRFTVFSLIGTIPWVLALALAGHALGSDWTSVRKGFEYVDYAIVALIVVGILYAMARRRARQSSRAPEDKPTADVS
jgi:membrane protein DedA with SNARE-associated domain